MREFLLALFVIFVCWLRAIIFPFLLLFKKNRENHYLAEDQAWNVILSGKPDETISARSYRSNWKIQRLINFLFNDINHCQDAYMSEKNGTQNAREYRK